MLPCGRPPSFPLGDGLRPDQPGYEAFHASFIEKTVGTCNLGVSTAAKTSRLSSRSLIPCIRGNLWGVEEFRFQRSSEGCPPQNLQGRKLSSSDTHPPSSLEAVTKTCIFSFRYFSNPRSLSRDDPLAQKVLRKDLQEHEQSLLSSSTRCSKPFYLLSPEKNLSFPENIFIHTTFLWKRIVMRTLFSQSRCRWDVHSNSTE